MGMATNWKEKLACGRSPGRPNETCMTLSIWLKGTQDNAWVIRTMIRYVYPENVTKVSFTVNVEMCYHSLCVLCVCACIFVYVCVYVLYMYVLSMSLCVCIVCIFDYSCVVGKPV